MTPDVFTLDTDLPCGRAGNPVREASDRFSFLMPADTNYMGYWCVRLAAAAGGSCQLKMRPDPAYSGEIVEGLPRSYRHRIGSGIFIRRGTEWQRVPADGQMHEPAGLSAQWEESHVAMTVRLAAGEEVAISNTVPWPYQEACALLGELCPASIPHASLEVIGKSGEGRDIVGIRLSRAPNLPTVLVLSGEHATEFAGQHAVRGICEFLASDDPCAHDILRRFAVLAIPQVNPDGNVHASMNCNALGANLCGSYFPDALDSGRAPECQALLRWAGPHQPRLVLNFHGGSWTFGNSPHHFTLRRPPADHPTPEGRRRQQAVDQAIEEKTQGTSRRGYIQDSSGNCIHNRVGPEQWAAAGLVYEPEIGSGVQECMNTGVRVLTATCQALAALEPAGG